MVSRDNREAARQDLVLVGLHPPAFPAVLGEIAASLPPRAILVSLAPKWTMGRVSGVPGGFERLARIIPNAPSIVNAGFNPVCPADRFPPADRARVKGLFAPLRAVREVAENTLEAYAIVAAMGPTGLWFQLYELARLGCEFGLAPEAAMASVTAMVDGAPRTMTGAAMTPEGLIGLIPVKLLAEVDQSVRRAYVDTPSALRKRLTS